jgi:hypothetical protein
LTAGTTVDRSSSSASISGMKLLTPIARISARSP